jgi:hypothetical protein
MQPSLFYIKINTQLFPRKKSIEKFEFYLQFKKNCPNLTIAQSPNGHPASIAHVPNGGSCIKEPDRMSLYGAVAATCHLPHSPCR